MMSRLSPSTESSRGEPFDPRNSALIEIPRFGSEDGDRGPMREQEWLIEDLNVDYIRDAILPHLMNRFLGSSGGLDYDTEVVLASDASMTIFGSTLDSPPDGSVTLLDVRGHGPRPGKRPPPERASPGLRPPPDSRGGGPAPRPMNFNDGRWRLLVRHHAGSLEALVERARLRNLSASAGLLLLILLTMALLVRFSRQSQRLAEQQMNFVASVSHELRTPLTVIRTAAFNLRGRLASRPEQVERYGMLIQEESEKLTALVEHVLRFASNEAGHVIREREPVEVEALIDSSLQSSGAEERAVVERHLQSGLPRVLADKLAMKHALENLVENALKYGTNGRGANAPGKDGHWVGVFASAADTGGAVEIRVADHGPGIPQDEQDQIFNPFFRGRRALSEQVHGTGLGLSLVKKIIEAHGGSIRVFSEPAKGTEFVVRIPAAPAEPVT
jgi:signal transduction histidine kinase